MDPRRRSKGLQRQLVTRNGQGFDQRKGRQIETRARKKNWERKLRHRYRVEKLAMMPKMKNGIPLNDLEEERAWMD